MKSNVSDKKGLVMSLFLDNDTFLQQTASYFNMKTYQFIEKLETMLDKDTVLLKELDDINYSTEDELRAKVLSLIKIRFAF